MRYPGGKDKLAPRIAVVLSRFIRENEEYEYREPFFGSGAIGLNLLSKPFVRSAWINDADPGVASIWQSIQLHPKQLAKKIAEFIPTTEAFYQFKEELKADGLQCSVDIAFKKIAVHQISFSGLGTMAGGPLGGKDQLSEYKIDSRWNANTLNRKIMKLSLILREKELSCTNVDFTEVVNNKGKAVIYLDPPYYEKGPELYQVSFNDEDHNRLRDALKKTNQPWLLSYDDCSEVRELYDFAEIDQVPLQYSINGSAIKNEVLISPKEHKYLLRNVTKPIDIFA